MRHLRRRIPLGQDDMRISQVAHDHDALGQIDEAQCDRRPDDRGLGVVVLHKALEQDGVLVLQGALDRALVVAALEFGALHDERVQVFGGVLGDEFGAAVCVHQSEILFYLFLCLNSMDERGEILLPIIDGEKGQLIRRLRRELVRQDDCVSIFLERSSSLRLLSTRFLISPWILGPYSSIVYAEKRKGIQFTVPAPASKSRTVSDVDMIVVRSIWHRTAFLARTIPRKEKRNNDEKERSAHRADRVNICQGLLLYAGTA